MAKSEKDIVRDALAYIENRIHDITNLFFDADTTDPRISTTWSSGAVSTAKTKYTELLKMARWLAVRESVAIPTAYTDAEVATIGGIL
jgi:hypothetical protein